MLKHNSLSVQDFQHCFGNQYQHVLHQESIDIIDRSARLSTSSTVYEHRDVIVDCADVIRDYNHDGLSQKATLVANFCWTLLDYGKAAIEGAVIGTINVAHCVTNHPVETAAYLFAGKYMLAYQLCKVVYNVADIGFTALTDTTHAKEKWNDYIERRTLKLFLRLKRIELITY